MQYRSAICLAVASFLISASPRASGQEKDQAITKQVSAAEADEKPLEPDASKWNVIDGDFASLRFGAGFLIDTANYYQNDPSKEQLNLDPEIGIRDFRFLFRGKFKFDPRLSYTLGYMYDGPNEVWRFRQTGLMYEFPNFSARIFVGRTKEGFSTSKLMVGYNGWTNERAAANDAFLPILADGVKWMGNLFGNKLFYSLGFFTNALVLNEQNYVKNDNQVATRFVWLPYAGTGSQTVLHLALEGRHGSSLKGNLQFRSKPESFLAQSFAVDTGRFPAESHDMVGVETYWRPGPLMFGSEYFFNQVNAPLRENPFFHGGEVFAAYLFNGEIRKYNEKGAYFEAVTPQRSVFNGGSGVWELVVRGSYVDLDSGPIHGGQFWRITPMTNWHLSNQVRLEFIYGYGQLNRYGLVGGTQFFQTRLQLQL